MKKIDLDNEAHRILRELPALCPISLSELTSESPRTVCCKGAEIPITTAAMTQLDNMWGITPIQKGIIEGASGERGITDMRNYLNHAMCKKNDVQAVIAINKQAQSITHVRPVTGKFITPTLFFEFVKMLIETTSYYLAGVHTETLGEPMVCLYFHRSNPAVVRLTPNDTFLSDGVKAEWSMGKARLNHYMMRVECSNQMTTRNLIGQKELLTLDSEEYHSNVKLLNNQSTFEWPMQKLQEDVKRAAETAVSLNELSAMKHLITGTGIDERIAEGVIPYEQCANEYRTRGFKIGGRGAEKAMGPDTIWHFYNRLTDFASHTECLAENDYRRAIILDGASRILTKTPDIQTHTYHNIY